MWDPSRTGYSEGYRTPLLNVVHEMSLGTLPHGRNFSVATKTNFERASCCGIARKRRRRCSFGDQSTPSVAKCNFDTVCGEEEEEERVEEARGEWVVCDMRLRFSAAISFLERKLRWPAMHSKESFGWEEGFPSSISYLAPGESKWFLGLLARSHLRIFFCWNFFFFATAVGERSRWR